MEYTGKKLILEAFDKTLNGTIRATLSFKKPVILDDSKRLKLGTQLRNWIKKNEHINKFFTKENVIYMASLRVQNGGDITTLIDMR